MTRILPFAVAACLAASQPGRLPGEEPAPELAWFFQATSSDERQARQALDRIAATWKNSYTPLIFDMARLMRPAARPALDEALPVPTDDDLGDLAGGTARGQRVPNVPAASLGSPIRARLVRFLEKQTGKRFGDDVRAWQKWMWTLPYDPHPGYGEFKGHVYANIDPKMRSFFPPGVESLVRLDEVDWGGVGVNGIPPLDYPKHIAAHEARYLRDGHIVFGIEIDGEARAYPKRILAWHELARDRLGGTELTIVYCTLCGTVIPYESVVGGKLRRFGTSGLLYRSNKLMFDEETFSLWSTLEGKPVIGSLAGSGLELRPHPIVTTTWGEWKSEHPNTRVLSLDTGHQRDYSEGAAYREYFSTDRLMFQVSRMDTRLRNKAEVLVMLLPPASGETKLPLAIAADFLKKNPIYHTEVNGHRLVVVTSPNGANRVYAVREQKFARRLPDGRIVDGQGRMWRATEHALTAEDDPALRLPRVPAQRAFWFGWYAQFSNTMLIK